MNFTNAGFLAACLSTCLIAAPLRAHAQGALITAEAAGGAPITAPQSERFGVGGALSVGGYLGIVPWVLVGVRARAGMLANGAPPRDAALIDPGAGSFETLSLMLRLRPFTTISEHHNSTGLFLEAGGGGAFTGKLARAELEAGIGYSVAVDKLALAPTLRFLQIVQPSDPISSADARVVMIGAELALLDGHPQPPAEAPPPSLLAPPADNDGDGIPNDRDSCPLEAEDKDGFADDDGCPDRDDDADGLDDAHDKCPQQAEDKDGFEDDDGCPEPDNDHDTVLDANDKCPDEAEVINGNQDDDGCADEGLIELRNDRIVLEEQVLFDSERARVRSAARPVLKAIMTLYLQHPEWVKIRIEGHADSRGDEKFNQELSERRAEHVRDELIKLGIPADAIEYAGYGSTRPRDRRDEEGAYSRNRRVEFVVTQRGAQPVMQVAPVPAPTPPAAEPAPSPAPAAPATAPEPASGATP